MSDTERQVNIPLLRKAVEWAEVEAAKPPELCEWVQSEYVVPISEKAGYESGLLSEGSWPMFADARSKKASECGTCYCVAGYVASLGEVPWNYGTASSVAADALGLTYIQSIDLFGGGNDIADVRRIAEEIAGERL